MKRLSFILSFVFSIQLSAFPQETLQTLADKFASPPMEYRPNVWWHWLGSNFTTQGITKDLEAMAESDIGGACIFNIASSVQESHFPMENLPFPEQTFRSPAYWNALKHTMKEAKRLSLTMGLHGTPGYATTGGPWISEERGMKAIISSKTVIEAPLNPTDIALPHPELPEYIGYDSYYLPNYRPHKARLYWDLSVMAIQSRDNVLLPGEACIDDVIEITPFMDSDGILHWNAPAGQWTIYRYGYAPTMAHPHPLPDDLIGHALEVDKMSREDNTYHWAQLLEPLKEHIGEYFGSTFRYIWVDSYESGYQNWTKDFREQFRRLKNYDVLRWIALFQYRTGKELEHKFNAWTNNKLQSDLPEFQQFLKDYDDVVNRLYMDNGFAVAREMLHAYSLKLYWEPYGGPFSNYEGATIADVPADEFWSSQDYVYPNMNSQRAAARYNKRIVAAEAFTGTPVVSAYTETPAFLKHTADGGFAQGMNLYFLHHWVHQPFDDKYQPGLGMGWWGTHFGRFQTWQKESRAFFTYLARCQMLLQQGSLVSKIESEEEEGSFCYTHRIRPDADIYFVINPFEEKLETFGFAVKNRVPQIWDAYTGTIRQTDDYIQKSDSIFVTLNLEKDRSVLLVFPFAETHYATVATKDFSPLPAIEQNIDGAWNVTFYPKLDRPFKKKLPKLVDFSKQNDERLKYFSGTTVYRKDFKIQKIKDVRIILDLGTVYDMATVEINGTEVSVLWFPPFQVDITDHVKTGTNSLKISTTNTWANRLIGDEQYPADFEWGTDRGKEGRAMKAFPAWFLRNEPRTEQGRKTFNLWYYYRKDSTLRPAGLLGPVVVKK